MRSPMRSPRSTSPWARGASSRSFQRIGADRWCDVKDNYAPATRQAIAPLMAPGYQPGNGRLLVRHGAPGTGKSFGLTGLAYAWRQWASFS